MLLRASIATVGAGRTDAGVHAHCMPVHFDAETDVSPAELMRRLNRILPPDIAVQSLRIVRPDAHARFSALSRTYHYYIYTSKNPFLRHYATRITSPLDFALMNQAAEMLLRTTDFTSFSKLHTDARTNICHVSHACWTEEEPDLWRFRITADRFLRNMVRAVVGTLVDVGRGHLSIEQFQATIDCRDRCAAGDSMPANALSLVDVQYANDIYL